jgi:hypothetical protein
MEYKIDHNDEKIIYRDVKLDLTVEELSDYKIITGLDAEDLMDYLYRQKIIEMRDEKINDIIKPY